MKKPLAFLLSFSLFFAGCEKDTILSANEIPNEISVFQQTHFPANGIIQVTKETEIGSTSYEVILQGGIKLEFNKSKAVKSISSSERLPDSVVPVKIREYVAANYATNYVVEWELEARKQQKVELNNGLDLLFSESGDFIRIDG